MDRKSTINWLKGDNNGPNLHLWYVRNGVCLCLHSNQWRGIMAIVAGLAIGIGYVVLVRGRYKPNELPFDEEE